MNILGVPLKGPILSKKHELYRRWTWMRQVCNNSNCPDYDKYGGRGISIGSEFEEFWDFVGLVESRLGPPPNGRLSKLARIDQDGDWTIRNLKWADAKIVGRQQKRTIKLTYKGKTLPLRTWSEITGINFYTLLQRTELGWTASQALGYRPRPRVLSQVKKTNKK
jgi:hypothetical protein